MNSEPTDWIKIWAIFGPIAGVILGAFGSWLQQWFSMRHSDRTRFHQLRVEVYSKYLHTVNKIVLDFLEGKRGSGTFLDILICRFLPVNAYFGTSFCFVVLII